MKWGTVGLVAAGAVLFVAGAYWMILRQLPGVTITSWFRGPWHNEEVGGQLWSRHLIGWAWDIVPADAMTQARLYALQLPFLEVIHEGDHLHVQIGTRG